MTLVTSFSYFMFSSVGFTRGFVDLWNSFKDDTPRLKRVFPSISYGILISLGYLSVPFISHLILHSIVGKPVQVISSGDIGLVGMR